MPSIEGIPENIRASLLEADSEIETNDTQLFVLDRRVRIGYYSYGPHTTVLAERLDPILDVGETQRARVYVRPARVLGRISTSQALFDVPMGTGLLDIATTGTYGLLSGNIDLIRMKAIQDELALEQRGEHAV